MTAIFTGMKGAAMAENEIILHGSVGTSFWDEPSFDSAQVREQLAGMTGDITVRINSGGGIASEGQAIFTLLRDYVGKKRIVVDAVAASAASLIAMAGDEIVSSRTIYGGTYAFMKNMLPKWNIKTRFVDITKLDQVTAAITPNTKVLYCETVSNPLLEVADIEALAIIAKEHNIKLVVDNTFSPLSVAPAKLGADVVIHSLTKFINGSSDTVGGVVCATQDFINDLKNVNDGASMLLGPTMDSLRASSILKNLRTLHIRMKQHSHNAMYLAQKFEQDGLKVVYPGLSSHPSHELYAGMINPEYGFGGMMTIDFGTLDKANELMELMQHRNLGYLAVSLGFYKTLFSAPGTSTSSEIPLEEQQEMGLTDGLIRFSIGLDNDIERTYQMMKQCMKELNVF
jgi:methionine-gamma-lyase